ncbi:unnamed protein product [Meloidogyne enterolobii]|uniref:Uncharacterized protein n=1 Tax=Meloidogyne enterolobii TaxID=390850 RepID=A0ACB0Z6D5_MELEN
MRMLNLLKHWFLISLPGQSFDLFPKSHPQVGLFGVCIRNRGPCSRLLLLPFLLGQ